MTKMLVVEIPDILEQKRVITEAEKKYNDLKQGEKWYAVPTKWWENWEALGMDKDPKTLGTITIKAPLTPLLAGTPTSTANRPA